MKITLEFRDDVSGRLAKLDASINDPAAFHADLGRRLANDLREWFRERQLNGPRNKFGAPSSGFWREIRDSVNDGEVQGDGVTVTIADTRFNQKYYGGTIKADDKLLAIPARTEAYGSSPRLFPFLTAIFFRSTGTKALVETERTKLGKGGGKKGSSEVKTAGMVWYWLVDSVSQERDPQALPPENALIAGLMDTAQKHWARTVTEIQTSPVGPIER